LGVPEIPPDPVKKHAVTAAGTYSFTYDPNGNAITQNGATLNWTAYNLPKLINQTGGNSSTFLYGPGRQRHKHVALNGATTETNWVSRLHGEGPKRGPKGGPNGRRLGHPSAIYSNRWVSRRSRPPSKVRSSRCKISSVEDHSIS
jgi:hypothetical protein